MAAMGPQRMFGHDDALPSPHALLPFAKFVASSGVASADVASIHRRLLASEWAVSLHRLSVEMADLSLIHAAVVCQSSTSNRRHAQTQSSLMIELQAPSLYRQAFACEMTTPATYLGVVCGTVPAIPIIGAMEIGLLRWRYNENSCVASSVQLEQLCDVLASAAPCIRQLCNAATQGAFLQCVKDALDEVAILWCQPHLCIHWHYGARLCSTSRDLQHIMAPTQLSMNLKLEGVVTHVDAPRRVAPHVGWTLGVVLHAGRIMPYYVGGSICDASALFPRSALTAVCTSDSGQALASLVSLVSRAMCVMDQSLHER